MNVRDLLKQLENIYLDAEIFVWVDGERLRIDGVDDSLIDEEGFADINAVRE